MKSLLVQLDEPTYRALNRVAPAAKRQRAEFLRSAIRKAIRQTEEERTRLAYLKPPDSEAEADDWSNAEEWEGRGNMSVDTDAGLC
jgi:metal-responsive CopG/Arc/MetJ family transcriptional regulator